MAICVPMSARRFAASAVLTLVAGMCFHARPQAPTSSPPSSSQTGSQSSNPPAGQSQTEPGETPPGGSTSIRSVEQKTVHQKTGPYSSQSVRHTRVAEEGAPPSELTQAEDAIQKHNYAAAEPLLRKVVEHDPVNYVAWFDLGFVENGLGKLDDWFAAIRNTEALRPDVFDCNSNLACRMSQPVHGEAVPC